MHEAVDCGRAIRVLSVVDAYTRECLALEVDTSFASRRVTRVLDAIVAQRGLPQAIRCDNGPVYFLTFVLSPSFAKLGKAITAMRLDPRDIELRRTLAHGFAATGFLKGL